MKEKTERDLTQWRRPDPCVYMQKLHASQQTVSKHYKVWCFQEKSMMSTTQTYIWIHTRQNGERFCVCPVANNGSLWINSEITLDREMDLLFTLSATKMTFVVKGPDVYTAELIKFDLTNRLIRRFPLIKCINRGSEAGGNQLAALHRPTIYKHRGKCRKWRGLCLTC